MEKYLLLNKKITNLRQPVQSSSKNKTIEEWNIHSSYKNEKDALITAKELITNTSIKASDLKVAEIIFNFESEIKVISLEDKNDGIIKD